MSEKRRIRAVRNVAQKHLTWWQNKVHFGTELGVPSYSPFGSHPILNHSQNLFTNKMDIAEKKKIESIEQQLLADKPWQLKGEVTARTRPLNSLLFEDVDYEQRIKAPIITPESTEALEAVIRQRIKDNQFDDPIRKVKPTKPSGPQARHVEISAEKSKVGLAKLYEQDIVTQASSGQPARDGPEKEVETKLFALFRKLDALVDR